MVYLLLGDDQKSKYEFVDHFRARVSPGLWGENYASLSGKEITSPRDLETLVRSRTFSDQQVIVIWDVDSLKQKVFSALLNLLETYAKDDPNLFLILEGSGRRRTVSFDLSKRFKDSVKVFGSIEDEDFFTLAQAIMEKDLSRSLSLANKMDLDRYNFQQFVGAMRYVIESSREGDLTKVNLLSFLVELDYKVRMGKLDPVWAVQWLCHARKLPDVRLPE